MIGSLVAPALSIFTGINGVANKFASAANEMRADNQIIRGQNDALEANEKVLDMKKFNADISLTKMLTY